MISENIRLFLEDFAQEYGGIDYNDISKFARCWDDIEPSTQSHIRRIIREIKKACRETGYDAGELAQEYPEDGETCEQLVRMIKREIKGLKDESLRRRGRRRIREGFGIEDAPGLYRRIYKIIRDNHINAGVIDTDDNDDYGFAEIWVNGDWKHDHLRLEWLLKDAFDEVIWREKEHFPSEDDSYEATYKVYLAGPKDEL